MAPHELTWGDVFEEVAAASKPLTTAEVVNCLFASFQDMLVELSVRVEQKEAA